MWSNPDVLNKTSLALKVGVEALNFYNSYYNIPYPLKKQGQVVVSSSIHKAFNAAVFCSSL